MNTVSMNPDLLLPFPSNAARAERTERCSRTAWPPENAEGMTSAGMLPGTDVCGLCEKTGTFDQAAEKAVVASNVFRFRQERFTVWRCPSCRSLHCREAMDPVRYYADYPMHRHRLDFFARRAFGSRLRRLRRHGLRKEHRLLDYGCGQGPFVAYLKEKGYQAVGYDPYVPAFADPLVLEQRFDAVVTQDVIEHADDPRAFLRACAARVRPGGMLLVGTPNADEIELNDTYAMEIHQPYHRSLLSEQALRDMGAEAGLTTETVDKRFYYDTLFPMVNTQFIRQYVRQAGGFLDAGVEPAKIGMVLSSPRLLLAGWFGWFFRARGNMLAVFRRTLSA